jgi:hypothetical protein
MGLQIYENGAILESTSKWSGKGDGVAAIPSPKNRAGTFRCTRLKPFVAPV